MSYFNKLDRTLRHYASSGQTFIIDKTLTDYAEAISNLENALVVISDLRSDRSIIRGDEFAARFGLSDYIIENSIWENKIIELILPEDREAKYYAELKFYNYVRRLPAGKKGEYFLSSRVRMYSVKGDTEEIWHRLYYVYLDGESPSHAVCIYQTPLYDTGIRSEVINSVTGVRESIADEGASGILSARERQVLCLVRDGLKSAEISEKLNISKHTVSRHRQEVISKLNVRNTTEAIKTASLLGLL